MTEVHEGVEIGVRNQKNTATVTAVSTIRTASGDEFLAPEAHATAAAVAGLDTDTGLIDELHDLISKELLLPQPAYSEV